ncbi:MAG: hypothetical protein ACTTJC_08675 [Campylobacter sp.]
MMRRLIINQTLICLIFLILTILLFYFTNFDITVQEKFYDFENKTWLINKKEPVLKFILYDGFKGGGNIMLSYFNGTDFCWKK